MQCITGMQDLIQPQYRTLSQFYTCGLGHPFPYFFIHKTALTQDFLQHHCF